MDRDIIRALAGQIADIASLGIQKETAELHRAVNSRRMSRPVVLLDELPWNQLNVNGELDCYCEDEYLRGIELGMRRLLWKWNHCRGDMLMEPFFALGREIHVGDIGVSSPLGEVKAADKGNNIVSRHLEDQLSTFEDLEKLRVPEIRVDDEKTQKNKEILEGIFGDILPVKVVGLSQAGFFAPWDDLAWWRGVEAIYTDLYDNHELLHATMRKITDIKKEMLRMEIEMGLLDTYMNTLHCTAALVDDLPGELVNGKVTPKNMWARGTAQVFASVSPAMHDEFEIEYVKEFFSDFGLLYYGCCEPLHDKIEIVKKMPNVRKLSITPWANVRKAAEQMGREFVMARKPNPAAVAVDHLDEGVLRNDILETLQACRENGTSVEFTLKDISSVNYHPENLTRWEQIVMETVKNF